MIGITAYGAYVPRLRLSRAAVGQANAWYAPQFVGRQGTRAFANWDEDSITLAVAAARDCLGPDEGRTHIRRLMLASCTLPFAERLNAAVVAGALNLAEDIDAADLGGSPRAALSALAQALDSAAPGRGEALVIAADVRQTRAGSAQELDYGDASAAVCVGDTDVLADYLGGASLTADFVDHFRASGEAIDYHWEERWVRDEGVMKLVPQVVHQALAQAGVDAAAVTHFILPSAFARLDQQVAKACGVAPEGVVDNLAGSVGDSGTGHALLMLAQVLEQAVPGEIIVVTQFGAGAQALVFRVTDAIRAARRPALGVAGWLARGQEERSYTKFLSFKGQLALERGMRGEQDRKTALSTAWRHRHALLGFVAGRCEVTGTVHFPPSRLSVDTPPLLDTQRPYPLADRRGTVLSWSAEALSWHPAPPHHYGQVDLAGGGRLLMDFTDLDVGEVQSGTSMDMVFRIKDADERRHYTRYFWKATPVRGAAL